MKNIKWIVGIVLFSLLMSFTIFSKYENKETKKVNAKNDDIDIKINELLEKMTLEEKIGQMIIINYNISQVNDELKSILEDVKPSGFILMQNNYTTYENTKKFVSDIKSYSSLPFIVSTDQEGGRVQRLQLLTDVSPVNIPFMKMLGDMKDE